MSITLKKLELAHGDRFGKLTVLEKVKTKKGRTLYRCGCECGNSSRLVRAADLTKGRVTGCLACSGKGAKTNG